MSDHRERSSLSLWFFPSQSRPGGQCPAGSAGLLFPPGGQCPLPFPSGHAGETLLVFEIHAAVRGF